jgi:nitroreductase
MDLTTAIRSRTTTNGPLAPRPVSSADQRALMEAAACAPSHFNSQPWRFVLIDDRETIDTIADISGRSMQALMEGGQFWKRYLRYFRFSDAELAERRDGIHIDNLPTALRPFKRHLFGPTAQKIMNSLGVPRTLGEDNRALVAGAPLLIAALLDREEYRPGELSGFYSVFGLGAAMENLWLTTTTLGMGIQFVSTPMEIPDNWERIRSLLRVPESLELMAVYRVGYLPERTDRPRIDWSSRHRKQMADFVFRNTCDVPDPLGDADPGHDDPRHDDPRHDVPGREAPGHDAPAPAAEQRVS